MSDNYIIQNEDRILRPVTMEDAEFIVRLRNQKHAKGFIHDTSLDVDKQREWLKRYFERENEYYWIITTLDGTPYGTVGLYNYDSNTNQIETGRWIKLLGYDGNMFSSHVQTRDFAFNVLKVDRVVLQVVSTNTQVLKYHKNILREREYGSVKHVIDSSGVPVEEILFEETRETWEKNRARLLRFCGDMSKWKILKQDELGEYNEI